MHSAIPQYLNFARIVSAECVGSSPSSTTNRQLEIREEDGHLITSDINPKAYCLFTNNLRHSADAEETLTALRLLAW